VVGIGVRLPGMERYTVRGRRTANKVLIDNIIPSIKMSISMGNARVVVHTRDLGMKGTV
jgi:hypothetical protein